MPQEKNKETLSEANRKVIEALRAHEKRLETDEKYRKECEKIQQGFTELKNLWGDNEE